jgi:hypothetical protein
MKSAKNSSSFDISYCNFGQKKFLRSYQLLFRAFNANAKKWNIFKLLLKVFKKKNFANTYQSPCVFYIEGH